MSVPPKKKDSDVSAPPPLSKREQQIMDLLFRAGEASVAEVTEALPDDLSPNSVRTFMTILDEKGHVTRRKEGREFFYSPATRKSMAGKSALNRVLDVFFEGSVERALASHFDGSNQLNEDEIAGLEALIAKAREERGNNK